MNFQGALDVKFTTDSLRHTDETGGIAMHAKSRKGHEMQHLENAGLSELAA